MRAARPLTFFRLRKPLFSGLPLIYRYCRRTLASAAARKTTFHETPIIIVGGGPSGLCLSNLLSRYNTPHVLFEAQSPTERFLHPQAHFLNTRTMEILRNCLPNVYEQTCRAMPPVSDWQHFNFGYSMASDHIMARVRHPVDRPLQKRTEANGVLVPFAGEQSQTSDMDQDLSQDSPLSACTVGHLAQHTFCRILYNNALREAGRETHILYDQRVTLVERDRDPNGSYSVHIHQSLDATVSEVVYRAPIVVAADGANSQLRRKVWGIHKTGQEGIQHLMNVHIRATPELASTFPKAMLYSIYNPKLLGMMVCHSEGEYILQIPFFPPYQTPQKNFSEPQVQSMVEAAFGISSGVEIVSIRPWSMSSIVADRYHDGQGGLLLGDSAHVFPPAGGFGMNTGIQDAHNLAWRLSTWYKRRDRQSGLDSHRAIVALLNAYEKERRPVAQRNAALSVRNYRRIVELSKACYLNDRHPAALISLLNGMSTLVSLETRQKVFQTLLETAMLPLSTLKDPSGFTGQHLTGNIRRILKLGAGLPLLFPKFELGFSYDDNHDGTLAQEAGERQQWTKDTEGLQPEIRVGSLFPHAELEVVSASICDPPSMRVIRKDENETAIVSSTDLPSQLCLNGPSFALILFCSAGGSSDVLIEVATCMASVSGLQIIPAEVIGVEQKLSTDGSHVVLRDVNSALQSMLLPSANGATAVLVRPDGHVASITCVPVRDSVDKTSHRLLQDLHSAIGTDRASLEGAGRHKSVQKKIV